MLTIIAPAIRRQGLKGAGQYYHMVDEDVVMVINFQKSRGGQRFFINLGVQPICLIDQGKEYKKIKEHECIFRKRIKPPEGELSWSDKLSKTEIDEIKNKIIKSSDRYFRPLS